jgi:hypothetical protein
MRCYSPTTMTSRSTRSIATRSLILACSLGFATQVSAQSLVVTDCQGFTRASQRVQPHSLNSIEVEVKQASGSTPADGASAKLTNQVTAQIMRTRIGGGRARFENLPPGVYALELEDPNLIIGLIRTSTDPIGILGTSALIVGAGGALVGSGIGVARIIDSIDGSSSDDGALAPTPVPTPEDTPRPAPTRIPIRATPTPDDCPQCEPGRVPPPLPSAFPSDQLPARAAARTARDGGGALPPPRRLSPFD